MSAAAETAETEVTTKDVQTPAPPIRVSSRISAFEDRLLDSNEVQHQERMTEARELRNEVKALSTAFNAGMGKLHSELNEKPGKAETRFFLAVSTAVFVLVLVSVLQQRGIDTTKAVTDTRTLLSTTTTTRYPAGEPAAEPAPAAPPAPADN